MKHRSKIYFACIILLLCLSRIKSEIDDIAFEVDDQLVQTHNNKKVYNVIPVQRGWGMPDTQAVVSRLFSISVPQDAFRGDIDHFEVMHKKLGKLSRWPKWLDFNKNGIFKGVPLACDVGTYLISLSAIGPHDLYKSKDVFSIEVIKPGLDANIPEAYGQKSCPEGNDPIMLSILLDVGLEEMEPKTRISVIENISGYLGLSQNMFFLHEDRTSKDVWALSDTLYFTAGGNNMKSTKRDDFATVSFQIGCGRKVDKNLEKIIEKIGVEALDGTLSEVLLHPVVGWHAKNELSVYFRERRQVGSGDLYGEEEDEDDYNEPMTTTTATPHPHRHHHGENYQSINESVLSPSEVHYQLPSTSLLINYDDVITTPVLVPERPTLTFDTTSTIEPSGTSDQGFNTVTESPSVHHILDGRPDNNETLVNKITVSRKGAANEENYTVSAADYSLYTYTEPGSTDSLTTDGLRYVNLSSETQSVTLGTTEEIELKNFKPVIAHRLKKIAITAGKILRYKIPENTFRDIEDGTTSHLRLTFKALDGQTASRYSWIKFDSILQEISALPLEEHVSKWQFEVQAIDSNGDSVSDIFELQIQQHKGHRAVNFEFSAFITVDSDWPTSVDWELKLVDALVMVYGDEDSSHITVRSVLQTASPFIFTWTNDTLPRSYCPRQEIDNLLKVIKNENEEITPEFRNALGPRIVVKKITVQGIGQCESKSHTPTPSPPQRPSNNYSPLPRNQIDQVNATAGKLLLFKVPEDTFYDPEDGSSRKMKMSLLNMDRSPLDPYQWLQFDSKNQEFFGVPMDLDVMSQEYQLVCEDRGGLTANDGLIVVVFPRTKILHSVEFTIALDIPYDNFANSSAMKRKFVEKLQDIFGDSTADAIELGSISRGSTIITWYNQTLRTDICPTEDIHRLREILINDDESMSDRLVTIMGSEFPVISVGLEPAGSCQGELTVLHKPESSSPPYEDNSLPIGATDDYFLTFVVPAVLIALMLILSGIISCLFYRKKRNSKLRLGDDDEKQSFRNKGIPVIFQDELEDKLEPENKCPVIMKEEKPPLPPPEYQRSQPKSSVHEINEDEPYQPPPPPFTTNRESGRNTRPKPTPTYRKPPPRRSTDSKSTPIAAYATATSKDEARDFMAVFPDIVRDLTDRGRHLDVPEESKWLAKVLQYNVPNGKKNRGLAVPFSYKFFTSRTDLTERERFLTHIMGWCVELLHAYFIVIDDIMDNSEIRRGRKCWYKTHNLGVKAINDGLLLEAGMYYLLKKYFRDKQYYTDVVELFHDVTLKTVMGQSLDVHCCKEDEKPDLNNFTMARYNSIAKYKTSYYSFQLPVALAMYMAGITDAELHRQSKTILLEMGHFYQVQDDYLDCFGDTDNTGKVGTDIEDGKCTWLAVVGLQRFNSEQRALMKECYGVSDSEKAYKIKKLYEEVGIPATYSTYEEESYNLITTHIRQASSGLPQELFFTFLQKIYRRQS